MTAIPTYLQKYQTHQSTDTLCKGLLQYYICMQYVEYKLFHVTATLLFSLKYIQLIAISKRIQSSTNIGPCVKL